MRRILIIKLGALGDFFMAQPAFNALRSHHRDDHVTLLTIPALAGLARRCGLFDEVITDERGRTPAHLWNMRRRILGGRFDFVYDLQGNDRTAWYWRILWPHRPPWAGPVRGCSHPRPPRPEGAHRTDWYRAQLAALGIEKDFEPRSAWLDADTSRFALRGPYVLLAASASAHRPGKRWPADRFAGLAQALAADGMTPVLIGAGADREVNAAIAATVPAAVDLTDRTGIEDLGGLGRRAAGAVGNDTGPLHVTAFVGCPTLVLFSAESDPVFIAPRGPRTAWLQRPRLDQLSTSEVLDAARRLFAR
jgi:ADP-heptose:LPS heptosyltransferase